MIYQFCCDAFRDATKDGTDNEGYASAVGICDDRTAWHIGNDLNGLPHVLACPWCGLLLREPPRLPPHANLWSCEHQYYGDQLCEICLREAAAGDAK
jgi:hypothetical protein